MKMTKKRVTAIALLLAMVLNLFSPYTNIVLAAPGTDIDSLPKPSVVLAINDYIESDGAIDVAIGLTGNYLGRGATVHVKWDKTKLTPATLGRKGYSETTSVVDWLTDGGTFHAAGDDSLTSWTVATTKSGWNLENGTAHIASADTSGKGVNPSLIKADAEWAEPAAKYNGFAPFIIFSFLVPDGMTSEEILTEGLIEIEYLDLIVGTEKANYYDLSLVNYDGLAEADEITGVEIKTVNGKEVPTDGTKLNVKYGENVEIGATILHSNADKNEEKTFTLGTDNEVAWKTGGNDLGNAEIELTYGEGDDAQTDTVAVNVQDYIKGITLNKETVEVDYGTELKNLGVTYQIEYGKAQKSTAKSITDGVTLTPNYDGTKSQKYTVTYTDTDDTLYKDETNTYSKELTVNLKDTITGVTITKVNGVSVTEGSTTDIPYQANTTVEVLVKHSVEADETKTYTVGTNNEVAWDVTPTNGLGNGQLSVTVGEETATVAVNVKDYVESITLNKESVTADKETELADLGVTYTVNYAKAGAKEAKSITDGVTINPAYDSSKSNQTLTVTYTDNDGNSYSNGKTFDKTLNVTLNEKEIPEKVIGFTLNKTSVTADKGTELKDLGVTYTVNYLKTGEQAAKSITDGIVKISPAYDSNKESQTLTITYTDNTEGSETKGQDFTETLTITLNEKETPIDPPVEKDFVTGIKLNKTSVTGEIGDSWSDIAKGITYTVNYSKAGAKSPKSITDGIVKISPSYDSNKESQTLTITYTDNDAESSTNGQTFTTTLSIILNKKQIPVDPPVEKDYVTGIKLSKTSVTGEIGDSWSDIAKGITYTVTYSKAGAKSPKSITDGIVKISPSYDSNKENQTLTITYTDNDAESSTNGQTFTTTLSIKLNEKETPIEPVDPGDNKEDNQKPNDNKENNNNGNNNSNNNNGNNNSSNSNTTNNNSTTIIKYITTTTGPTETTSTDKEDEMKELEEKNKELEEKVNELEATIKEQKEEDKKDTDELPTATLGVQDKKDTSISDKLYLIGLLILATGMLALLLTRKNAKIYALVDGKERLIGKVKVHDENTMIDVNKYLNGDTYNKHIKVVLNKEISNKLDGKEIHIKYKDQTTKSKVNYADDNYKIDVK